MRREIEEKGTFQIVHLGRLVSEVHGEGTSVNIAFDGVRLVRVL